MVSCLKWTFKKQCQTYVFLIRPDKCKIISHMWDDIYPYLDDGGKKAIVLVRGMDGAYNKHKNSD